VKRALFALLLVACRKESAPAVIGDTARGKQLVEQYACSACHVIPGVTGPRGMVGPSLTNVASRAVIAGKFPNTRENMVKYLGDPQAADPANVMPNFALTLDQRRDITAFLYTLK
jgi:cytochrome c2